MLHIHSIHIFVGFCLLYVYVRMYKGITVLKNQYLGVGGKREVCVNQHYHCFSFYGDAQGGGGGGGGVRKSTLSLFFFVW